MTKKEFEGLVNTIVNRSIFYIGTDGCNDAMEVLGLQMKSIDFVRTVFYMDAAARSLQNAYDPTGCVVPTIVAKCLCALYGVDLPRGVR